MHKNDDFARNVWKMGLLAPFSWNDVSMTSLAGPGYSGMMWRWMYGLTWKGDEAATSNKWWNDGWRRCWRKHDASAETEGGKWFYRTAFCTGAVSVSGSPMQWEQDTRPWYGGNTTGISEANVRIAGWFRNRREPSDGRAQIRRWTKR